MTKFSWDLLNNFVNISKLDKNELADEVALKVLEVDELTDDYIDIDVTPNRAHDCLSHIGIAREIATITNQKFIDLELDNLEFPNEVSKSTDFSDEVYRFIGVQIDNVSFNESPQWLQDRLAELGQKSINTLVDLTNYVMFEIGQPLHAYDADKLPSADLGVRFAKDGETVQLLDGKNHKLTDKNLLIVDSNDMALGLAGVKGGSSSQISDLTTSILLESANFDATIIRKSAGSLGIRTDALKRFENNPSPVLSDIAARRFCQLLLLEQPKAVIKSYKDYYPDPSQGAKAVEIRHEYLEQKLGLKISSTQVEKICRQQSISLKIQGDSYQFTAPYWRLDLQIAPDYVEEFGRLLGYENIAEVNLPKLETKPSEFDIYTAIRDQLTAFGLFEVQTYSLVKKGDLETIKPLASNKGSLRNTINKQLVDSLKINNRNAELFGVDKIGLFEIGSVFLKSGEEKHLCVALSGKQKSTNKQLEVIREKLKAIAPKIVKVWDPQQVQGGAVVEVDISGIKTDSIQTAPASATNKFKEFSNQPFITRDISVWVGENGSQTDLETLIQDNTDANLSSYRQVDRFEKDGRLSLAYRLVFQSPERTLTDTEVQEVMDIISKSLQDNYDLR